MPKNIFYLCMALVFWAGLFGPLAVAQSATHALVLMSIVLFITNIIILFNPRLDQQGCEKLNYDFLLYFLQIVIGIGCLYWLSQGNISLVFLACVATWGNNSCAYFGGRAFGKHPLFKRISAKKTWEGFIAGALGSLVIINAMEFFIPHNAWHPFYGQN